MLSYKTYLNKHSNKWIVLIHGIGIGSSVWFRQVKELKSHINILMIDLNGHGKSMEENLIHKAYHPTNVSRDILEVLDYEGIQTATFAGLSLGAVVVNAFSMLHPERVEKKILIGGILKLSWLKVLFGQFVIHFNRLVSYRTFYTLSSYAMLSGKQSQNARQMFITAVKKMNRKEYSKWFKYCINYVNKVHYHTVFDCPNIYIMGDKDRVLLNPLKREEASTPNLTVKIVENAGHVCNIDNYMVFNTIFKECILS